VGKVISLRAAATADIQFGASIDVQDHLFDNGKMVEVILNAAIVPEA